MNEPNTTGGNGEAVATSVGLAGGPVTHTPGPWIASKGAEDEPDRWLVTHGGKTPWIIATIENGQPGDTLETEGATARLIAAAPDLLAALRRLEKRLPQRGIEAIHAEEWHSSEQARTAIAKALAIEPANNPRQGCEASPGRSGCES